MSTVDRVFGSYKPYYLLNIYIDQASLNADINIIDKYRKQLVEIQNKVNFYKVSTSISSISTQHQYVDAGVDLFTPKSINIGAGTYSNCVDQGIKCAMSFGGDPTAFYLYPRSSTGSKTPLRLSNSVGIIDSGYRGNIIAAFDNTSKKDYVINSGDRLVQICGPNIMYPVYPVLVDSVDELGFTSRNSCGFGSTGR